MNQSGTAVQTAWHRQHAGPESSRHGRQRASSEALRCVQSIVELGDVAAAWIADELSTEFIGVWIRSGRRQCESAVGDTHWMPLAQGLSIREKHGNKPLVRLLDENDGRRYAVIVVQLEAAGVESGTVVAVTECSTPADAQSALKQLTVVLQQVNQAADRLCSSREHRDSLQLTTLGKSMRFGSVGEFCFSLANGLRVETDMDLVAVGLVNGLSVRLACVSGLDEVDVDSPGSQLILRSMEEAADQCFPISAQCRNVELSEAMSDSCPLTEDWQQQVGNASVASIPLMNADGRCVAVIGVQGRRGRPLRPQQLQRIADLASPLVASIELMQSGQRSLLRHTLDSAGALAARICGPVRVPVAGAAILFAAFISWMVVGTTDYVVRTPCTVIAAQTHTLTAPWDGPLDAVLARPGEMVEAGQLLARMETRRLLAEREQQLAALRAAQVAVYAAVSRSVPAETGRALSRQRMAEADLAQIDLQLADAEIRAPCDGRIVSVDLVERTGETVPIGEPLFEIVPDGDLALDVELSESVVSWVAPGQPGSFAMNADPGRGQQCRVERIEPSAEAGVAGNVVSARAVIPESPDWLRPGMQGVVQINTGERPVWWVWLHRAIDSVRFRIWSFTGTTSGGESDE